MINQAPESPLFMLMRLLRQILTCCWIESSVRRKKGIKIWWGTLILTHTIISMTGYKLQFLQGTSLLLRYHCCQHITCFIWTTIICCVMLCEPQQQQCSYIVCLSFTVSFLPQDPLKHWLTSFFRIINSGGGACVFVHVLLMMMMNFFKSSLQGVWIRKW